MATSTVNLDKTSLTKAQRAFYDVSTPGIKATIVRTLRSNGGNTTTFKSWFRTFKSSV